MLPIKFKYYAIGATALLLVADTGLVLCNDKHQNSKLTNEVVIKIREDLNNCVSFKHIKSEFKELNLTTNMLSKIKNNRTWRNLL